MWVTLLRFYSAAERTNPFFLFPCFVLKLLKWKNEEDAAHMERERGIADRSHDCGMSPLALLMRTDFCARAVPTSQPCDRPNANGLSKNDSALIEVTLCVGKQTARP